MFTTSRGHSTGRPHNLLDGISLLMIVCSMLAAQQRRKRKKMAPKYKLTYFKIKGRAEPIRLLLAYGKQEFEDVSVDKEKWPQIKPTVPFGKVPILEVDGVVYHQSAAICRHLARKFGLAGSNEEESLQMDILVDTFQDMNMELMKNLFTQDAAAKEAGKKKFIAETLPYYAAKFESTVKANGGFFVGGKLSWADIMFATLVDGMATMHGIDALEKYPTLKSLQKKVFEEPNIKAWMARRKPV